MMTLHRSPPDMLPSRAMYHHTVYVISSLLFLVAYAQGLVPGVSSTIRLSVQEEQNSGAVVGNIPTNAGFVYKFSESSPYFTLGRTSGVIRTKVRIDRENLAEDVIDLLVLEEDLVRETKLFIEVRITVLDINDNPPTFPRNIISLKIPENAMTGAQAIDTAEDLDKGANGTLGNYTIISGNEDNKFRLVHYSPTVVFLENQVNLNREDVSEYLLKISVSDQGTPKEYGYLLVNVSVTDINDNPPVFDHSDYYASLNESAPIGTSVIEVQASDQDIGANKEIYYSLDANPDQFRIDPETGHVYTTRKPIRCHRTCNSTYPITCENLCIVTVIAHDKGIPSLPGRAYLSVNLIDENDNYPVITFSHIPDSTKGYSTISENTSVGTIVALVTVTDLDEGMNGQTDVQIAAGNVNGRFQLIRQANINLVKLTTQINRDRFFKYNLTILVTDRGTPPKSSIAYLVIYVSDANAHAPHFLKKLYEATLSETTPVGSYVASVTATESASSKSDIVYSIVSGDPYHWFRIDAVTGLVTVIHRLDAETASDLMLNISAEVGSPSSLRNFTQVSITITNENDMAPTFSTDTFTVGVDENSASVREIITLTGEDFDVGQNGTVVYEFPLDIEYYISSNFAIDRTSGLITALSRFDREYVSEYKIRVIARDLGNPSLSTSVTVNVQVHDLNDNNPEFQQSDYYVNMEESSIYKGKSVVQVTAMDADAESNGRVSYSITEDETGKFRLHENTGVVTTPASLSPAVYTVKISAHDNGSPRNPSLASATVHIAVLRNNVDLPTFTGIPYEFSIEEDSDDSSVIKFGRRVGQVHAVPRTPAFGMTYKIESGDQFGIFQIDSESGVIKTAKKVDREQAALYHLTVLAQSGSSFRKVSVEVTITDINDNAPTFPAPIIQLNIPENFAIGYHVLALGAVDNDDGLNGQITYIAHSGVDDRFEINSETGLVSLNTVLQEETQKSFTFHVIARDNGTPAKSSSVQVILHGVDVNDHTPLFRRASYEISLPEATAVNTRFLTVETDDVDSGENARIIYSFMTGNIDNVFGIFPSGEIYISKVLDRETVDFYLLTVMAMDNGIPPRSSSVNVTIHISDSNDNEPVFTVSPYTFSVTENLPGSTMVGIVSATDADSDKNGEVFYYFETDNDNFNIDHVTGIISTKHTIDREALVSSTEHDYFLFDVTASDRGQVRLNDTVSVKVYIQDINDNEPRFTFPKYTASVLENSRRATRVIQVSAQDSDDGLNGSILYKIVNSLDASSFDIDRYTGDISVSVDNLDREIKDSYLLEIVASDRGEKVQFSTSARVEIKILDENDNYPEFVNFVPEIGVSEDIVPGTVIYRLSATDKDIGHNSTVSFRIDSGNVRNVFSLDAITGNLILAKNLDFETTDVYTLNVTVSDQGFTQLTTAKSIVIRVTDVNDNLPSFPREPSLFTINERLSASSFVGRVVATDPDGVSIGKLVYTIVSQEPFGEHFTIGSSSGELITVMEIDREIYKRFNLTISVEDRVGDREEWKRVEKEIVVTIHDLNDNSPMFVTPSIILVSAGLGRDAKIGQILATDADSGPNGQISYDINFGDKTLFRIDSTTGELFLNSRPPSNQASHDLRIMARDNGVADNMGQRSTSMEIRVFIISDFANGPTFQGLPYSAQIYENQPSGETITRIRANSGSEPVEYYLTKIASRNEIAPQFFRIDRATGLITATQRLDRDGEFDSFTLDVYAVSQGTNALKARKTQVQVTILDINDTPPAFSNLPSRIHISEAHLPGSPITMVTAEDPDTRGDVLLSIVGGNDDRLFYLNSRSGLLTITKALDHETTSEYTLMLRATDGNHTTDRPVVLVVTDTNDNPPRFTETFYTFNVLENTAVGTIVNAVVARDADEGENAEFTYRLESVWGSDVFELDPDYGTFKVIGQLDFEQIPHYILEVSVSDKGTPSLTSSVTVYMNIQDVNDNEPVFDPMSYSAEVFENAEPGTSVLTVTATDVDIGASSTVLYAILSGDPAEQFSIHQRTGVIMTSKHLDTETTPLYQLVVTATDSAELPDIKLSTSTLVEIRVKDVNDERPVFTSPDEIWVSERTATTTPIFTVHAQDPDAGRNGEVEYRIGSGSFFRIGLTSGEIFVTGHMDYETAQSYSLSVLAVDKGVVPMTATQEIFIHVLDANDHTPAFIQSEYRETVTESMEIGSSLLRLTASDADKGWNGIVGYFLISGDENNDFRVEHSTGIVRIQRRLDFERKRSYTIIATAEDYAIHSRSATVTIQISVTNANDNVPFFIDAPYQVFVQENRHILPVHVVQVSVRDFDSPLSGEIMYSIRNGDRNLFAMNSSSGIVTALKPMDREAQAEHTLVVIATDSENRVVKGSSPLTGSTTITVQVQDDNDNSPFFIHPITDGFIFENLPPQTEIMTLKAMDKDEGRNAEIRYSLKNDVHGKFAFLPETGTLVATMMLDREEQSRYELVVIAMDNGLLPRAVTSHISVTVDDANDNAPQFEETIYRQYIANPTESNQFILGVTALDLDSGVNSKIRYSISGTDSGLFHIYPDMGVVLNRQQLSNTGRVYYFTVNATDQGIPPKTGTTSVEIRFLNSNGADKPTFEPNGQMFTLPESQPIGHHVTRVSAKTMRFGTTGTVSYHIAGGNVGRVYSINSVSGDIEIQQSLDYEAIHSYNLWIEARDDGSPPLSNYKHVQIDVTDENDNSPRFTGKSYHASINEQASRNTFVVNVTATDSDSGRNGEILYRISSGNDGNAFKIEETSGVIRLNARVDRERNDYYILVVKAIDQGTRAQHTGTTLVHINITDTNDNLSFNRMFGASIPEDTPIGSFVLHVYSTDHDIGQNANIKYNLSKNPHNLFAIDPAFGYITVNARLDADITQSYVLEVLATDLSHQVKAPVSITITDVNDNAPVFNQSAYEFSLPELLQPNSFVGKIEASDHDLSPSNNHFYFTLKLPSPFFYIHSQSGEIFSKTSFKFNTNSTGSLNSNYHNLVVIATDTGIPPRMSEVCVSVHIRGANTKSPQFTKMEYIVAVHDGVVLGTRVVTVTAIDPVNRVVNADVEYGADGGNGSALFTIDQNTGDVKVMTSLAGRRGFSYMIHVLARYAGLDLPSSSAVIVLQVTGPNHYAPRFTGSNFATTIPESSVVGRPIITIRVSDGDSGLNGDILFSLESGNSAGMFAIGRTSGILKVAGNLDYEEVSEYQLNVRIRDQALAFKEASRIFILRLTDVNDNPPIFNQSFYEAFIPENVPDNTEVIKMMASDADSPVNSVIAYSLTGSSQALSTFAIDTGTGVITTASDIDYEEQNEYLLQVIAKNPGTSLQNTVDVHIYIQDRDEFVPLFKKSEYSFETSESAVAGTEVGQVTAIDQDRGSAGVVLYYLVSDSNMKAFKINTYSGMIALSGKGRPDYESSNRITLKVMAKNYGSILGNNTDICTVYVTINDANDAPVFTLPVYRVKLLENVEIGFIVETVKAKDSDRLQQDQRFTYQILNGNLGGRFAIESDTGIVRTQSLLDREVTSLYTLTLGAVDAGTPPKTGTALLKIVLLDVNDNGPEFSPSKLVVYVTENQNIGTTVTRLADYITDPDGSFNREPYLFTHPNRTTHPYFSIDPGSGLVRTLRLIDREVTPEFTVPVIVADNGSPRRMSSFLTFRIVISDMNDSPSASRDLMILSYIYDNRVPVLPIARVEPLDKDTIGRYSCTILHGGADVFAIPSGCDLQMRRRPGLDEYVMSVRGSDGVHSSVTSQVSVQFEDLNSNVLNSTLVMQFIDTTPEIVLRNSYLSSVNVLRGAFSPSDSIQIYKLDQHDEDVLCYIAIRELNGNYRSREYVKERVSARKDIIQKVTDLWIGIIDYSPCDTSPCFNSGSCVVVRTARNGISMTDTPNLVLSSLDIRIDYRCDCLTGFTGSQCENSLQRCGDSSCKNGGTCITSGGDTACTCSTFWHGPTCEVDVDECEISPCANRGQCQNVDGSFKCHCQNGYTGSRCMSTYAPHTFGENSYIETRPLNAFVNLISVTFVTVLSDSLLLFNPSSDVSVEDFFTLEIVANAMRLSFALDGESAITRVSSPVDLVPGSWYRAEIHRVYQTVSLKVVRCTSSSQCDVCLDGDPACHIFGIKRSGSGSGYGELKIGRSNLYIGGVRNFSTVLERPNQLETFNFIGCMSVAIDNRNVLVDWRKDSREVTPGCLDRSQTGGCTDNTCMSRGQCLDEWTSTSCRCDSRYSGTHCENDWIPAAFSNQASIRYIQRESYRNAQLFKQSRSSRRKRDTQTISSSSSKVTLLDVNALSENGVLFFSHGIDGSYSMIFLENGIVTYKQKADSKELVEKLDNDSKIKMGKVFNVTLHRTNKQLQLMSGQWEKRVNLTIVFDFTGLDIRTLSLGAYPSDVSDAGEIPAFSGCIGKFYINDDLLPFSGKTDRFNIETSGDTAASCQALVAAVLGGDSGGISTGVIVVIVILILLLIAGVIAFVIFRRRRRNGSACFCFKAKQGSAVDHSKQNGNGALGRAKNANDITSRSQDSGYAENNDLVDDAFIRNHIEEQLSISNKSSVRGTLELARPDIIEADRRQGTSFPLEIEDGTIIIEDGDVFQHPFNEPMAEHYDLENASSIAPSDIDIFAHYKGYRDGRPAGRHKNKRSASPDIPSHYHQLEHLRRHHPPPGINPPIVPQNHFNIASDSNQVGSGLARQSPASSHSHNSNPSLHHSTPGSRRGSHGSLHHVSPSPLVRGSPYEINSSAYPPQGRVRQHSSSSDERHSSGHPGLNPLSKHTPPNQTVNLGLPINMSYPNTQEPIYIADSERSISSGSVLHQRRPNGQIPSQHTKKLINRHVQECKRQMPSKGLSVEDVQRLNTRHYSNSPVSMLDAVSSTSGEHARRRVNNTNNNHNHTSISTAPVVLLEPVDSTSEDSANDSFTCSEFDNEQDKARSDMDMNPSAMIFSKLTEVENENDDSQEDNRVIGYGTSVITNDLISQDNMPTKSRLMGNGVANQNKPLSEGFDWDSLLNWGPNYEKLVGVFKDIALLPDKDGPGDNKQRTKVSTNAINEEYV